MESTFAPHTGRLDRHVRRSVLRVGEGVSRHRIAYSLEEALRLATLPGEEEGRIYCFRSVSLSGIPAEANRRAWTEQIQQLLGTLAAQAVHASNPGAGSANAVFFNNFEELLETLLRKAVRSHGATQTSAPEWFSNSVIGAEPGASYAQLIPAILERLRPPAITPGAAAAILFAALGSADPVSLLSAIPNATLREWLRELDDQKTLSTPAPPVQLPSELKTALQRAASHFSWKAPATVWLATQAVISLSPASWNSGSAVTRARATLRILEQEQLREPLNRAASILRESAEPPIVFDDDDQIAPPPARSLDVEAHRLSPQREINLSASRSIADERLLPDQPPAPGLVYDTMRDLPAASSDISTTKPLSLGEATQAAGLYFLLNVLQALGIATTLNDCPALAEANLAIHILRRLAIDARVANSDPILLSLNLPDSEFTLPARTLTDLPLHHESWPHGFSASYRTTIDSACYLRVWTVATKRWLWRMGRLTLSDVINRSGRLWLTRTDLDVTLPLAAADLRIRRIGLDIDPGWLPWFGECGRVVRFHYRDREPEGSAC